MRFLVYRDADGWHLYSHELTPESWFNTFPTKRAALTAIQVMRMHEEEEAITLTFFADDD